MRKSRLVLMLTLIAVAMLAWVSHAGNERTASIESDTGQAVPYVVLDDQMGSTITIGVPRDIAEQQLRATLVKAANEHQDDPARDYLSSAYLLIDAYLIDEKHRSSVPAGRLRRLIPFQNPAERRRLKQQHKDELIITLEKARQALN